LGSLKRVCYRKGTGGKKPTEVKKSLREEESTLGKAPSGKKRFLKVLVRRRDYVVGKRRVMLDLGEIFSKSKPSFRGGTKASLESLQMPAGILVLRIEKELRGRASQGTRGRWLEATCRSRDIGSRRKHIIFIIKKMNNSGGECYYGRTLRGRKGYIKEFLWGGYQNYSAGRPTLKAKG